MKMKLKIELDSAYGTAVMYEDVLFALKKIKKDIKKLNKNNEQYYNIASHSSFKSNKNDEIELKYELSECLED